MKLGTFSISLSVKNIHKSKEFYEKIGFEQFGGNIEQNYLIMKNGSSIIGLFEGMFESNILTFNPGWDADCNTLEHYDDVRTIQKKLQESGIPLTQEADVNTKGPASIMVTDPDGNTILFDQHI